MRGRRDEGREERRKYRQDRQTEGSVALRDIGECGEMSSSSVELTKTWTFPTLTNPDAPC